MLNSDLFSLYRSSFEQITGHTVSLVHPDTLKTPGEELHRCLNSYCLIIRQTSGCSKRCLQRNIKRLTEHSRKTITDHCEAGLTSSIIAIKKGSRTFAYLRTGQIRMSNTTVKKGELAELLHMLPEDTIAEIQRKFDQLPTHNLLEYRNQLVILSAFALQLGDLAARQLTHEPQLVLRSKKFITQHLQDRIQIDEIARHTGVTPAHLAKQFKTHTGMTLVEYINFTRIKLAQKTLLASPGRKIIDIAYDCGFQSLSQFNRTFQRFASLSPSAYRKNAQSCSTGTCEASPL
ncbi:MAG: helix-turn-helix domain-containing protein [Verrucomicrobiales bacterium]